MKSIRKTEKYTIISIWISNFYDKIILGQKTCTNKNTPDFKGLKIIYIFLFNQKINYLFPDSLGFLPIYFSILGITSFGLWDDKYYF